MCFTPRVSFATAAVEILTALYLWVTAKRIFALKLLVFFLVLLGMYQFSEFMICTSSYGDVWSRVGFISYNFLPAVGLHIVLSYSKIKFPRAIVYLVPATAAFYAVLMSGFVSQVACHQYFVTIKTPFFNDVGVFPWPQIYFGYYFGAIFVSLFILIRQYFNAFMERRKRVFLGMMVATLISLVPAYIFIVLLPGQGVKFPSIYCQFAILFALMTIYAARRNPDFLDN